MTLISLLTSSCNQPLSTSVLPKELLAKNAQQLTNENLLPSVYRDIKEMAIQGACNTTFRTSNPKQTIIINNDLIKKGYKTYFVENGYWIDISWCD